MSEPLVSIIIPAYNSEAYISQTIESVMGQTYKNWELLIIDDGSTDKTSEVIKTFLQEKKIRYIHQSNAGVSAARNRGIEHAGGDYIAFLDSDDFWLPENLSKKVAVLNDTSIDWTFSNIFHADESLHITGMAPRGSDVSILDQCLLWKTAPVPNPCSNVLAKRKCFLQGLRFDTRFSTAADQDFIFYLAKDFSGKLIHDNLLIYRVLPNSMSRNLMALERDHLAVYKKASNNKIFRSFAFKQRCFSNVYFMLAGNWWVNGKNKKRGMMFIFKALLANPLVFIRLMKKIINTYFNSFI